MGQFVDINGFSNNGKVNVQIINYGDIIPEDLPYLFNKNKTYPYDRFKMEIQPVINKFEKVRMFIQNHKSELIQVAPHPTYDVNLFEKSISIRIDAIKTHLDADMKVRGGISSPHLT